MIRTRFRRYVVVAAIAAALGTVAMPVAAQAYTQGDHWAQVTKNAGSGSCTATVAGPFYVTSGSPFYIEAWGAVHCTILANRIQPYIAIYRDGSVVRSGRADCAGASDCYMPTITVNDDPYATHAYVAYIDVWVYPLGGKLPVVMEAKTYTYRY